jgi:hypothetical protein
MFSETVFSLFVASFVGCMLLILLFFCSIRLFSVSLFDYPVYFCVQILELYSRYFIPIHNNNHPPVNKHHTSDSTIFVLVYEVRAYYHHRHSGISGTSFSRWVNPLTHGLFEVRYLTACGLNWPQISGQIFPLP